MRLIDADELKKHQFETYQGNGVELEPIMVVPVACIDNAPTVEERPQAELVEQLKDRIEKLVCKHCRRDESCVLCEISRVFQIITLTMEEQKGGTE